MKFFSLFPFMTLILAAHAEYRVFQLQITKTNPDPAQPAITRTLQSTLDPEQYQLYYPLQNDETVKYTDTWMCKGRTGGLIDFCPNPKKAQIPEPPILNSEAP